MSDERTYAPPAGFSSNAWVTSLEQYRTEYERSVRDPEAYWSEVADGFEWHRPAMVSNFWLSKITFPVRCGAQSTPDSP